MDTQPLDTARLTLRPAAVADAEAIHLGWSTAPEVTRDLVRRPHAPV